MYVIVSPEIALGEAIIVESRDIYVFEAARGHLAELCVAASARWVLGVLHTETFVALQWRTRFEDMLFDEVVAAILLYRYERTVIVECINLVAGARPSLDEWLHWLCRRMIGNIFDFASFVRTRRLHFWTSFDVIPITEMFLLVRVHFSICSSLDRSVVVIIRSFHRIAVAIIIGRSALQLIIIIRRLNLIQLSMLEVELVRANEFARRIMAQGVDEIEFLLMIVIGYLQRFRCAIKLIKRLVA